MAAPLGIENNKTAQCLSAVDGIKYSAFTQWNAAMRLKAPQIYTTILIYLTSNVK